MLPIKSIIHMVSLLAIVVALAACGNTEVHYPNPVVNGFRATPSIISSGEKTTLSWDYGGGVAYLSDGVSNRMVFANATTVRPTATTSYKLAVISHNGQWVSASTTVTLSPIQGRFSSVGATVDARDNHTATLLLNGKVLLAGGGTGVFQRYKRSAELYDPATGTFAATGFMGYSTALHAASLLTSGKVLVTGGWDGTVAHANGQLYDPATGLFTATGSMSSQRSSHSSTLLPNGKVLVTGGWDGGVPLSSAELYDPATGLFTVTGSMNVARFGHSATLLNNGMVLIVGGNGADSRCELYDPATGTFTLTPGRGLAYPRSYHAATLLSGGTNAKVLIAGGAVGSVDEVFDPLTGTFGATGPMSEPRTYLGAALLSDTRVIVMGGSDQTAEYYDPVTRTFALTRKPMKEARSGLTATVLTDGTVLVAGGTGAVNRAELFH